MNLCPCGSGKDYDACCKPLIDGEQPAETAEALMRSRYTAHAKQAYDYLFETTLPDSREEGDRKGTEAWSRKLEWQGLEVRAVEKGAAEDTEGTVEFVARYRKNGKAFDHHEVATFTKLDDRWYFKDGQPPAQEQVVRQGPKVGRNDSCPCGSGKKYKKCCGA